MVVRNIGNDGDPLQDFLLDGFPRTLAQARFAYECGTQLDRTFHAVIMLAVPEDELVRRLLQRGTEKGSSDDTADNNRNRLRSCEEHTAPLVELYRECGIILRIARTGYLEQGTEPTADSA